MNRFRSLAPLALAVVVLVAAVGGLSACGSDPEPSSGELWYCPMHPEVTSDRPGECPICHMDLVRGEAPAPESVAPTVWTCPMHPEVVSERPGECPICHMDLVPAESAGADAGAVEGRSAQPAGAVATVEAVERASARRLRTSGRVLADERRTARVESRFSGWVETLDADFTGERVRRGERLAVVDSPELFRIESEYVAALAATREVLASTLPEVREGGEGLRRAARRRVELVAPPEGEIERLDAGGEARRRFEIRAPRSGFVASKGIVEGQRIAPGMELFTLVDLSRIWIEADLYEADAALARVGQTARITSPFDPALAIEATATYVYPELDPTARTLRVRFEADNPDEALRPGMFVDVDVDLGGLRGVSVPDAAVLPTGERTLVYVVADDGEIAPREVVLAGRQDGVAWVREGLSAGERVVAEPAFLFDSESRLREARRRAATPETAPRAEEHRHP